MKITAEAIYKCEPKVFFEEHFNKENRAKRETDGCGAISYTVLESSQEGGVYNQVAQTVEKLDAPGPIRKIFGETTMVEENSTWKEGSDVMKVFYRPDKMREKVSFTGQFRCTPHGEGTSKVVMDLEVKVKIFGLGGMIEKMLAKDLPKRFQLDAKYFNDHIAPNIK